MTGWLEYLPNILSQIISIPAIKEHISNSRNIIAMVTIVLINAVRITTVMYSMMGWSIKNPLQRTHRLDYLQHNIISYTHY